VIVIKGVQARQRWAEYSRSYDSDQALLKTQQSGKTCTISEKWPNGLI